MVIEVKHLRKEFISIERGEGLFQAFKSLVIRKKKISKAVDNINFNVLEGEIVGFLGPNGAGKSTTIKMLSGIMHPDGGTIKVLGYTPWTEREKYVKNIGVVFGQKSQLFWDLPPIDAFALHKAIYSVPEEQFRKTLDFLVNLLGINDIMKKPTRQLSLGERMRCEFVMALLHRPKMVFLDEPTIGLDIFAKETIRSFIKEMNQKFNTTFIVTSHDLEDIEHLCDRVIIINEGRIVFNDLIDKLIVANKKYLKVKYYDKVDLKKLRSLQDIKVKEVYSDYAVELEINTSKMHIDEVIKKIRLGKKIEDLEINNPPITELIKKLYNH